MTKNTIILGLQLVCLNLMADVVYPNVSQKILMVPVQFKLLPQANNQCTKDYMKDIFNSDVNPYSIKTLFKTVSRNSLDLTSDFTDPITIDSDPRIGCDFPTWSNEVDSKLKESRGIITNKYQKVIYVFPQTPKCNIPGQGEIGSYPGNDLSLRSWIWDSCSTRTTSVGLYSHELGHNFGLHHANSIDESGTINEAGDESDMMGYKFDRPKLLNGLHTEMLGFWGVNTQTTVSRSQGKTLIVTISSTASDIVGTRTSPQLLKVDADATHSYFVSYRGLQSYDNQLDPKYLNKVQIHLPATPDRKTYLLRSMGKFESFYDSALKVNIRVLSIDGVKAQIEVKYDPVCEPNLPLIKLAEKKKVYYSPPPMGADDFISYDISILNTDVACAVRSFNLDGIAPFGIMLSMSKSNVVVESGVKSVITANAYPDWNTPVGKYVIPFKITPKYGITVTRRAKLIIRASP